MANVDRKIRRFIGFALLVVIVVTGFSVWLYFNAQYQDATRQLNEYRAKKEERLQRQEQFLKFQRDYTLRSQEQGY